jgi:hypothetical protein
MPLRKSWDHPQRVHVLSSALMAQWVYRKPAMWTGCRLGSSALFFFEICWQHCWAHIHVHVTHDNLCGSETKEPGTNKTMGTIGTHVILSWVSLDKEICSVTLLTSSFYTTLCAGHTCTCILYIHANVCIAQTLSTRMCSNPHWTPLSTFMYMYNAHSLPITKVGICSVSQAC